MTLLMISTFTPVRYRHAVILRVYFGDSRKKDEPLTMMQTKVPVFLMNVGHLKASLTSSAVVYKRGSCSRSVSANVSQADNRHC